MFESEAVTTASVPELEREAFEFRTRVGLIRGASWLRSRLSQTGATGLVGWKIGDDGPDQVTQVMTVPVTSGLQVDGPKRPGECLIAAWHQAVQDSACEYASTLEWTGSVGGNVFSSSSSEDCSRLAHGIPTHVGWVPMTWWYGTECWHSVFYPPNPYDFGHFIAATVDATAWKRPAQLDAPTHGSLPSIATDLSAAAGPMPTGSNGTPYPETADHVREVVRGELASNQALYGTLIPWLEHQLGLDTEVDYNELLAQYAPIMNYDPAEDYFADSPAALTDSYVNSGPPGGIHWNSLLDGGGSTIADSVPQIVGAIPQFNLGSLRDGLMYSGVSGAPDFGSVDQDDRVDAYGSSEDDYVPDAQRMHAVSTLGNQIYGRAVADGGKIWLQYWFFYYADWVPGGFGIGDHEGDWEMVQIGLDPVSLDPSAVTFAAHKSEETSCLWSEISKSTINGTPVPNVFVALGTHASYPFPGEWDRGALPNDNIGPDGIVSVRPNMVAGVLDGADWTYWPGSWGNSHGSTPVVDQDSPRGPRFQNTRWNSPADFNDGARACPNAALRSAARARALPRSAQAATPRTSAREHGPWVAAHLADSRHVRVKYRFRRLRTRDGQRLHSILVTGRSKTTNAQPRTYGYRVRSLRGAVTQDLPLGRGPFTIRVAAMTRDRKIVATTTVRVRG